MLRMRYFLGERDKEIELERGQRQRQREFERRERQRENNRRRGHKSRKAAEAEKSQPARALATPRRTVASAPLPRHRCAGRARKPRCVEFFIARFISLAGAISLARALGRVSISRFDGSSVRGFDGSIIRSFECSILRFFDAGAISLARRRFLPIR